MKKIVKPLVISACAALLVMPLSGCWGDQPEAPAGPAPKNAANVEKIFVHEGTSVQEVIIFDVERNGVTLTCSTKMAYTAGISCIEKPKQ